MTISYLNGTLTLTYTATAVQMTKVLANAAEELYPGYRIFDAGTPRRPISFTKLSNIQKLDIIDKHIKSVIRAAAEKNRDDKNISVGQTDNQNI